MFAVVYRRVRLQGLEISSLKKSYNVTKQRLFTALIAIVFQVASASLHADRATLDPTKTQFALPVDKAPTIDGVIEPGEWQRAAGGAGEWKITNSKDANGDAVIRGGSIGDAGTSPENDQDLSFNIYASYDAENLYIAVRVNDATISVDSAETDSGNGTTWMDDSVEVFVDGDNSNFGSRDTSGANPDVVGSGGQFVITANNAYREAEAGNPGYGPATKWYAKTTVRDDGSGYDAEFRISLKAIGNPKPGDYVGFTVGVNDDDNGGGGERQVIWIGKPHTECTYGNLVLGRRSYTAPQLVSAPTVDGIIHADEYAGAEQIWIDGTRGNYELNGLTDGFSKSDHSYRAWVVHTADSIYVAVNVTDDIIATDSAEAGSEDKTTWEDDSIEIFFDPDLSRDQGRGTQNFEGQFVLTANGAWRDNEANNPTFGESSDWFAASKPVFKGYAAEFRIKKSAVLNPATGATLGFNIAVNDDDGANRKAQLNWCGRPHNEFTYGDLKLGPAIAGTTTPAGRLALDDTKTQFALPMESVPTIDGVIESGDWQRVGGGPGEWKVYNRVDAEGNPEIRGGSIGDAGKPPENDQDLSFNIYAGYDADYLYVAVRVNDSAISVDSAEADSSNGTTWMDDSVEVFIDGDNSNFASRDTSGNNPDVVGSGGQFVITANNAYREAEAGNPGFGMASKWFAKTAVRSDGSGYDAEFRISLKSIGNPKPGEIIGFTVGVNDDDDGSGGERQLIWVGKPHTESSYGNLMIGRRSYVAPKAVGEPTVDGVIHSDEYAGATEIQVGPGTGNYELNGLADGFLPSDHSFRAWAVYTADAIHVAVDVTDDKIITDSAEPLSEDKTTWEDDSVEIFFDADKSRDQGRGAQNFEGQFVLTANGAWRDNEANNPTYGESADWYGITKRSFKGYQAEFKVKRTALFNAKDGATLGFNIAVNDDDGANRKSQLNWSGRPHNEFTYGDLTLGTGSSGGGNVDVKQIQVIGNNLQITYNSTNPAASYSVRVAPSLTNPQWTDVSGVTFGTGAAGTLTATFAKPATTASFYRIQIR